MNKIDSKKLVVPLVVVAITLFVMGATYAWLTLTLEGTKDQVVTTGTLALILDDSTSTGITLDKAVPTIEEVAMKKEGYTFTLENTGDIDSKYTIYLDDLPLLDSEIRLEDKYIRYNLQNDQGLNKTRLFSNLKASPNRVLDSGVIAPGKKYTYTLRIWLDYDADNGAMGKTFKGKIRVEAQQDIEYLPAQLIRTNYSSVDGVYDTIGQFWDYKANITKVVFQNEKKKPTGVVQEWDVSTTSDGTVMAYLTGEESVGYTLYLQANGPVQANSNSDYLFRNFVRLQTIEGLENLDTKNVTSMFSLFSGCNSLTTLDLSNVDTSQVVNMYGMFSGCSNLSTLDLSNFDTANVNRTSWMFKDCSNLVALDLSHFDTSKATDMSGMFYGCSNLSTLDLSSFNTAKVTDMSLMFSGCNKFATLDLTSFNTANVTNMGDMFYGCSSLTSLDLSNFDTSKVTNMTSMFANCSSFTVLDLSRFDTSKVTNISYLFSGCSSLTKLDLSNFNIANVTTTSNMFSDCSSLTTVDLSSFDTSKVTKMTSMFYGCSSLTTVDLFSFNTANVTDMGYMFFDCKNLTKLDISNFNIANVTSSADMFYNIKNTAQILVKDSVTQTWVIARNSNFSTSNVLIASV